MNKNLGNYGESLAVLYLMNLNFKIVERNFYIWGGEIDIIATKDMVYHIIEVKTRTDERYTQIESSVSKLKFQKIKHTAKSWLSERNLDNVFWQIDFIGIIIRPKHMIRKIEFIKNISL